MGGTRHSIKKVQLDPQDTLFDCIYTRSHIAELLILKPHKELITNTLVLAIIYSE
jgi:hypothetical protein